MFGKLNSKNSRKIGALKITPVKIKVPIIYIVLRILLFFEGFEPRNISLKIVAKTPNQAVTITTVAKIPCIMCLLARLSSTLKYKLI